MNDKCTRFPDGHVGLNCKMRIVDVRFAKSPQKDESVLSGLFESVADAGWAANEAL